jgi:prevent-host-death family protein
MTHYSVAEAKNNLPKLLDRMLAGEDVVITRRGKPIARLEPESKPQTDFKLDLEWLDANRIKPSEWTLTEFTSALSHLVRARTLSERERNIAELAFDRWAAGGIVLEVPRERFQEARTLMRMHQRLRAPDALHLAIARHAGLALATVDRDMKDAAVAEGMDVVDL